MSLEKFQAYYQKALGLPESTFNHFMETIRTPLPSTFRVTNTPDRKAILEILKRYTFLQPVQALEHVYTFKLRSEEPEYKEFVEFLVAQADIGNIQRQEMVSMLPHMFTQAGPNHYILETCAAPGSKTKQFLEVIKNGVLLSNDRSSMRTNVLVAEASKKPCTGFISMHCDAAHMPSPSILFDRVCCDVPCSSDGTVRKNPAVMAKWSLKGALGLYSLQRSILQRSLELLKEDGMLVYSTCSFNPIENEYVIDRALKTGKYELCDPEHVLGENISVFKFLELHEEAGDYHDRIIIRRGITKFNLMDIISESRLGSGASHDYTEKDKAKVEEVHFDNGELSKCLRVLPQDRNTGGFFIAILKPKKAMDTDRRRDKETRHKFVFYDVPNEIMVTIKERYSIENEDLRFISLDKNYKYIYALSKKAYMFIQENPRMNINYSGIKAFVKTDLGDKAYRPKSAFMEYISMKTDVTSTLDDFIKLLKNKTVPSQDLSFSVSGHFSMSVAGLRYKFAGYAWKDGAFLYIDTQRRKALQLIYTRSE